MLRAMASGLIFSVVLFGCATQQKEYSPKEWREAMKDGKSSIWGPLITIEAFDAPRPYQQITETLRKKSKECLDLTVHSSGMVKHGMYWVRENSRTDYKPILTTDRAGGEERLARHRLPGQDGRVGHDSLSRPRMGEGRFRYLPQMERLA